MIGGRRIIRVDCEYRDPNISIFLDGRAWHAESDEKVLDDLEVRNTLEAAGSCVLEYAYQDVMNEFDRVADEIRRALDGPGDRSAEAGVQMGAPEELEWYMAFGLMVTLVWLYIWILKLLALLSRGQ